MSENITLEVINESVALTQVVSSDVIASAESGNVIVEQVLPNPITFELLSGATGPQGPVGSQGPIGPRGPAGSDASVTEANITTALGYTPDSPSSPRPPTAHTHTKSQITDFPTLATVATSGSYDDLSNKPTIPAATTDASLLTSGTLSDLRLSDNVSLDNQNNNFSASQTFNGTANTAPNQTAASGSSLMTRDLMSVQGAAPFGYMNSGGGINPMIHPTSVLAPVTTARFDQNVAPVNGDRRLFFGMYHLGKPTVISKAFFRVVANTCVSKTISSLTQTGGIATAVCSAHGFVVDDNLIFAGAAQSEYNIYARVRSIVDANTFTFNVAPSAPATATGTITASEGLSLAFYNADPTSLLPTTIISGSEGYVACNTNTIKQITFSTPWTTPAGGFFWYGIAASRRTNNGNIITIPCSSCDLAVFSPIWGSGSSTDMAQFRGGVSVSQNQIWGVYNNISLLPNPPTLSVATNASSGSGWASRLLYIGIQP